MSDIFIGRKAELEKLESLYQRKMPKLVVLKGLRRLGKTRLIKEFASKKSRFWSFTGIALEGQVSAQDQRDEFARQLFVMSGDPIVTFHDWGSVFNHFGKYVKPGDIILFDEISWMGSQDPTFIPKLKVWWDEQTKHMLFVLCGSVSTWI